jgi:hypothetical protein
MLIGLRALAVLVNLGFMDKLSDRSPSLKKTMG